MHDYNQDYYFVVKDRSNESYPSLMPDQDTSNKDYSFKKQPMGQKPFIFSNGRLESQLAEGITPTDPPPDILFSPGGILVKNNVREILEDLTIPNLAIQAAIYIDHKDQWHENYWFLTFLKDFDCWDREKSKYDDEPVNLDVPHYEVYKYSLNNELLDKTPLQERLLFKMGASMDGIVVAHASVAKYFRKSGAKVVPVEEY